MEKGTVAYSVFLYKVNHIIFTVLFVAMFHFRRYDLKLLLQKMFHWLIMYIVQEITQCNVQPAITPHAKLEYFLTKAFVCLRNSIFNIQHKLAYTYL